MANSLIYKVQPTEIVNDVNNNLQNYEIDFDYTTKFIQDGTIAPSASVNLTSPTSLSSNVPFIELISNYPVDLIFKDASNATITSLTDISFFSGNLYGYSFSITNNSGYTANYQWSIRY